MSRASTKPAPGTMRDAFRYSPGDGHTYTWDGSRETADVCQHFTSDGLLTMETVDRVPMAGVARTATAFMAAVDQWHLAGTDWRTPSQRLMP